METDESTVNYAAMQATKLPAGWKLIFSPIDGPRYVNVGIVDPEGRSVNLGGHHPAHDLNSFRNDVRSRLRSYYERGVMEALYHEHSIYATNGMSFQDYTEKVNAPIIWKYPKDSCQTIEIAVREFREKYPHIPFDWSQVYCSLPMMMGGGLSVILAVEMSPLHTTQHVSLGWVSLLKFRETPLRDFKCWEGDDGIW